MNNKEIYENIVYVHNVVLTTNDDIPYMYKPRYRINENIYLKFKQFRSWNYDENVFQTILKMEEMFLVKAIHCEFPKIPKEFNRLVSYDLVHRIPKNFKKVINCNV